MIFTIGNKQGYDRAIAENKCPEKLGRRDPSPDWPEWPDGYPGGIVFQTAQEARDFIAAGRMGEQPASYWDVYGLLTDWETGTYVASAAGYPVERALLKDTQFISLTAQMLGSL
jgi:hypothetical protein